MKEARQAAAARLAACGVAGDAISSRAPALMHVAHHLHSAYAQRVSAASRAAVGAHLGAYS